MKRITAFICAFVILFACVPAFAVYSDLPTIHWSIVDRKNIAVCGDPWYGGIISSSAIATDAVSRVVGDGYTSYAVLISPESDTGFTATVLYYLSTPVDAFSLTWGYYSGSLALGSPLFDNTSVEYLRARVNYSGSYNDFTYTSVSNRGSGTLFQLSNFDSAFINDDLTTAVYTFTTGVSAPGPDCAGTFTASTGDAYITYLPFTTGPGYNGSVNFSLNPGNVLVFERSGGFSALDPLPVSGTSLPKSLGWLEKTWSTGVTYGPSLAYPSTSTNLTENYLFWDKVPGTQNLWGITTSGTGSIPIQGPNDFYWIVNPIGVYRNSKWVNNPPITITFNPSDFDAVYLTPMINMDGMAYIPESFDPVYKKYKIDFDVDSGDTSYTDTATDTSVPSADANRPGGLNGYDDVEDGAIGETVGGILGILQSGARAIESLVNGARSFFDALNSMYDWLPDDVQTILKASLFLVFAIGVIKVLH